MVLLSSPPEYSGVKDMLQEPFTVTWCAHGSEYIRQITLGGLRIKSISEKAILL